MRPNTDGAEAAIATLARSALDRGLESLARQDMVAAVRWLERAHRLAPADPNIALTLAGACLAADPDRAAALFAGIAGKHDVRQAWLGLGAARLRLNDRQGAAEAACVALSRYALVADSATLAERVTTEGWCGLRSDGTLEIRAASGLPVRVTLDGKPLRRRTLPAGWERGRSIEVRCGDRQLLGSPISIGAIRRVAGCAEVRDGEIRGWAWHPGDPDAPVVLTLRYAGGSRTTVTADDDTVTVPDNGPLARPRAFRLTRDDMAEKDGLIEILGPNGQPLAGSPLAPNADSVCRAASAGPDGVIPRRRAVTVVIPVHNGGRTVTACLESVVASLPATAKILVIDDGSTDAEVIAALDAMASRRNVSLMRRSSARGFPASANDGFRATRGRDVVLLDSHAVVPGGWLRRLRDAAYEAADIGTVTPFSNEGGVMGYPGRPGTCPAPDQAATIRLDRLAWRANAAAAIAVPAGAGPCIYLRRDCLDATGPFRTDVFAQGHGGESDFSVRASRSGWRHAALTGLFVGHAGGMASSNDAVHLRRRNASVMERLHPGYQDTIDRFLGSGPLAEARHRIDLETWKEQGRGWRRAAILITHNEGGGVERRLALAARTHAEAGRRPIVLRPADGPDGQPAITVWDGMDGVFPNLIFPLPDALPALVRLLRGAKADRIEAHHLADYHPAIYDLIARLALPYEVHIHDYALFCPRVSLVAGASRYCGEPDLAGCETCVADNGSFLREDISVAGLRGRSGAFLAKAERVVVPAEDVRTRMRRYFPGVSAETVPHEDDGAISQMPGRRNRNGRASVCVVGAIGVHKGYEVILDCARDAGKRALDLEFVIVGHTIDDERMLATGHVFVTGEFKPGEAVGLIAAQRASLGFVPSICPETWCLGLGEIWRAGLTAAAFDIGVPAERIRRTGRGFVLPLGLSANAINNALVAAIRSAGH